VSEVVPRAVVLVEGVSDRVALTELARRGGVDLAGRGVEVVDLAPEIPLPFACARNH